VRSLSSSNVLYYDITYRTRPRSLASTSWTLVIICSVNDDVREEFSTLQDVEAHATIVANELGHHSSQAVIVSVFSEDGILLAKRRHLSDRFFLPRASISAGLVNERRFHGGKAHELRGDAIRRIARSSVSFVMD